MIKAQGESKPYLYWKLVSAAVTHCQSLNYHRESTYRRMPPQESERIRRLFWTVYIFDKNMSLVLGRLSSMQSLDIDAQHPKASPDPTLRAWDESFIMGIRLAEVQGRIFVDLYSPVTMTRDIPAREQLVRDLALVMEKWYLELKQINPEGVNGAEIYSLSRGNWDILFYSTQTLLFHASSALGGEIHISPQCFAAAQSSLRAHLDVFPRYQEAQLLSSADYCNWWVRHLLSSLHSLPSKGPAAKLTVQDPPLLLLRPLHRNLPTRDHRKGQKQHNPAGTSFQHVTDLPHGLTRLRESLPNLLDIHPSREDTRLLAAEAAQYWRGVCYAASTAGFTSCFGRRAESH